MKEMTMPDPVTCFPVSRPQARLALLGSSGTEEIRPIHNQPTTAAPTTTIRSATAPRQPQMPL
jgi:hypothetical protein